MHNDFRHNQTKTKFALSAYTIYFQSEAKYPSNTQYTNQYLLRISDQLSGNSKQDTSKFSLKTVHQNRPKDRPIS